MIPRKRSVLRAAAIAGAILGASLLAPAAPAQASASKCHLSTLSNGARAWCEVFTQGTKISSFVKCEKLSTGQLRTVYGTLVGTAGTWSDSYCGAGWTRYDYGIHYV